MFFLSRFHSFHEKPRRRAHGTASLHRIISLVLGGVLITAAALKTHQLAVGSTAENGFFTSRWFSIGLVEFELALGLWLLSGVSPQVSRLAALLTFAGFGAVSLHQALAGKVSCGCIGKIALSPWFSFLFDTIAVAALWCWRPLQMEHLSTGGG